MRSGKTQTRGGVIGEYRSWLAIFHEIVRSAKNPANITKLMLSRGLSWAKTKENIMFLASKGLLKKMRRGRRRFLYRATEKRLRCLELMGEAIELIKAVTTKAKVSAEIRPAAVRPARRKVMVGAAH